MDINRILASREDKVNFLKGLIRIANADGVKDNEEILFFHQFATALGLNEADLEKINSTWKQETRDIKVNFSTNEAKMFFFVQAIQLCWIDDSYSEFERKEIRKIATEIEISETAISNVESWVEEGMAWNKRGESLLELQ